MSSVEQRNFTQNVLSNKHSPHVDDKMFVVLRIKAVFSLGDSGFLPEEVSNADSLNWLGQRRTLLGPKTQ